MQLLLVFLVQETSNVSEQGVGKDSYIMSLGGIESWARRNCKRDWTFPRFCNFWYDSGRCFEPTPADYNIESISYDTVILGKEYLVNHLLELLLVSQVISMHHKLLAKQFLNHPPTPFSSVSFL